MWRANACLHACMPDQQRHLKKGEKLVCWCMCYIWSVMRQLCCRSYADCTYILLILEVWVYCTLSVVQWYSGGQAQSNSNIPQAKHLRTCTIQCNVWTLLIILLITWFHLLNSCNYVVVHVMSRSVSCVLSWSEMYALWLTFELLLWDKNFTIHGCRHQGGFGGWSPPQIFRFYIIHYI